MTQDRVFQHIEDIRDRAEQLIADFDALSALVVPEADEAVRRFAIQLERLADHVAGLRADLELA